ncbi:hypothetical protein AB1N83_006927 [Pleurotus pulmonarius]
MAEWFKPCSSDRFESPSSRLPCSQPQHTICDDSLHGEREGSNRQSMYIEDPKHPASCGGTCVIALALPKDWGILRVHELQNERGLTGG